MRTAGTSRCQSVAYEATCAAMKSLRTKRSALQARRNVGLVPSLARPVLLAANGLGDKLTDLACDVVPDTIERGTVCLPLTLLLSVSCVSCCVMSDMHHIAGRGCC